jgi:hypothetical protein
MAVAPPALVTLTDQFKARHDRPKSYVMGGIVGDAAHMSPPEGYHVSYNDLGGRCSSYGLSFTGDCAAGKAHPTYASAWDLSMNDADMITVTTRLINAAKAKDPRVAMCWEIAGTTNGRNVHAYYLNSNTDDPTNKQQWASSHMHHVHISFRRDHVTDLAKLAPLLDVICGVPLEEEMTPADIQAIGDSLIARLFQGVDGHPHQTVNLVKEMTDPIKAELDGVAKSIAALKVELDGVVKSLAAMKPPTA